MSELLSTDRLSVSYGGNTALSDVSLRVDRGELVGLIGPNGAGKTSFIDALTGFTPSSGTVQFDGHQIEKLKPHHRAQRGLVRTWQGAELYEDLTVHENLEVGKRPPTWRQAIREFLRGPVNDEQTEEAIRLLDIAEILDKYPDDLSQGQRKSIDVARALATGAQMLCLDEPAAGLDSNESLQLGKRLRGLVDAGRSLLLVDHDMGLVLGVCDRIYVLDLGKVIAAGTPEEIRHSPVVIEAYLGAEETEKEQEATH